MEMKADLSWQIEQDAWIDFCGKSKTILLSMDSRLKLLQSCKVIAPF
jgi:hypothetical protein